MLATSDGPRIEDFGITEDDLSRAPRPFLSNHRAQVLAGAYAISAALLFSLIVAAGDSLSAAAFFTVIALAAGSVLMLPILVVALCAGERAEERWLCRRVPILKACLAYQRALAEHHRNAGVQGLTVRSEEWQSISQPAFVELMRSELERCDGHEVSATDRERTGIDFLVEQGQRRVLIRCEAGSAPVGAAVGRELVAAVEDFRAEAALIVAVSDPTAVLEDYIADRPIVIAAPWSLDAALVETSRADTN